MVEKNGGASLDALKCSGLFALAPAHGRPGISPARGFDVGRFAGQRVETMAIGPVGDIGRPRRSSDWTGASRVIGEGAIESRVLGGRVDERENPGG